MANEFKVKKGLIAYGSGAVVLDIQGSQGQLMSVTDTVSSTLFSVKNLSGTERFAVSSSGDIKMPNLTTTNQSNVVTIDTSTGLLYYTASSAFGGGGGSSALTSQLAANTTVGGVLSGSTYAVGTTLESLFRDMLITYYPPTLGSFSLKNGGSFVYFGSTYAEVNTSFTFNTASFTATVDSPNNRYAYSSSFTASGATTGDFNYYFGNNVLGSSNNLGLGGSKTINRTTDGNVTFTLNAKNPQTGDTIAVAESIYYVYPYFYGMSATDYRTTGDLSLDGNLTKLITGQSALSLSITGALKYVYFAYPASYPDLTSIKDGNGFEQLNAGITKYTRTQAGTGWSGISYKIYISDTLTTVSPAQTYIFT